jgi:hypothetical protein
MPQEFRLAQRPSEVTIMNAIRVRQWTLAGEKREDLMRVYRVALASAWMVLFSMGPALAGENRQKVSANSWVRISEKVKPVKRWSSIWYMPATDEFINWGRPSSSRWWGYTRRYDVETLNLSDTSPTWKESFPREKEEEWAKGLWPDWDRTKKPKWKVIRGPRFGSEKPGFNMSFVKTEDILRPNHCPIFNQGTWDSKRKRMFFFVGGKTFTYDPVARIWEDLKAPPPIGCHCLIWHTLCYDPAGDKVILFGGGAAMNLQGGAKTLLFDFAENAWVRPKLKGGVEPALRCTARMVYDSRNKLVVLFGGNAMDRALSDTWVLDPAEMAWEERKPKVCPPPTEYYGACYIEKAGVVFACRPRKGSDRTRWSGGDSWAYDAKKNEWLPLKSTLPNISMRWVSCDYSPKQDAIVLAVPRVGTWIYRPDPEKWVDNNPKRAVNKPGEARYFYAKQRDGILKAPKPDRKKHQKWLEDLPDNKVVVADYPGTIHHKTWSSATIDTDKGVLLYTGGGHSGYAGNEILHYDVGVNRWLMDSPPCLMPFLGGHGSALYGWGYRLRPSDQHTYRWYAYDPVSKLVVYLAREGGGPHHGQTVLLDEDPEKAFVYNPKKHKYWTWVYDPNTRKWFKPIFGRPFKNTWALALIGTSRGIFAKTGGLLYRIEVIRKEGSVELKWHREDGSGITGLPKGYGGEYQPIIYDSRRERLLFQVGPRKSKDKRPVMIFERSLTKEPWKRLETKGPTETSREVVYDRENDCLISLGKRRLFVMNCKTNEWKELDLQMPNIRYYGVEEAMVYDPIHKLCVFLLKAKKLVHLFRYNPKTAKYKE